MTLLARLEYNCLLPVLSAEPVVAVDVYIYSLVTSGSVV